MVSLPAKIKEVEENISCLNDISLLDDFRLFLSWSLDLVLAASDFHYVRH